MNLLKALKFLLVFTFSFFFVFYSPEIFNTKILAVSVYWDGGASTANWGDALNWSTDTVPTDIDDVLIDVSTTVNISATTTINSLILGNSGGTTTPILNFAYDAAGTTAPLIIDEGNVRIFSGAKITHSAGTTAIVGTINIDVQTGDLTINSGGSIDVTGKGFQHSEGDGAGTNAGANSGGGGAGYGGSGGNGEAGVLGGSEYGSISNPINLGSGGGDSGSYSGGNGGGLILLSVGDTLDIQGNIYSNGSAASGINSLSHYSGGGGSGGGINITTNEIKGAGNITADGSAGRDGGNADGGGGSGGRIAINYSTNNHTGTKVANGGLGPDDAKNGAAGTVYLDDGTGNGDLIVSSSAARASLVEGVTSFSGTFDNVTISGYAYVKLSNNLAISEGLSLEDNSHLQIENSSTTTYDSFSWIDNSSISDFGGSFPEINDNISLTIPAGTTLYSNLSKTYTSASVSGTWSHWANSTTQQYILDIDITNDLTINSGGSIDVTGKGFQHSEGDGAGTDGSGDSGSGGAGYGGSGGNGEAGVLGGSEYGSISNPTNLGSGGGDGGSYLGGNGGGLILLSVGGTLDVQGNIYSNGSASAGYGSYTNYAGGGGSGGGINITTNEIKGAGNITADGSTGSNMGAADGGGGSGGRIAINYSTNNHTGTKVANGGLGPDDAKNGAAGTVYLNDGTGNGDLIVSSNAARASLVEGVTSFNGTFDNVTISGYSYVKTNGTLTVSETLSLKDSAHLQVESLSTTTYTSFSWLNNSIISDFGGSLLQINDNESLSVPSGTTLYSNVARTYNSGSISGTWSHWANSTTQQYILDIDVTNDLTINSGANIDVTGKGFQHSEGDGAGTDGVGDSGSGGAGYGGNGGNGENGVLGGGEYGDGDIANPINLGSGGGDSGGYLGGNGGGLILLSVGGTLDVQGNIYSNGSASAGYGSYTNHAGGGGSGGGINITTNEIKGSGNIIADGSAGCNTGKADGGGGSGGRIAINYVTNNHTGTRTANGGLGPDAATDGENGTINLNLIILNSTPSVDASDIVVSEYDGDLYAGHEYNIESIYSDGDGSTDLDVLYFKIQNTSYDIEMYTDNSVEDLTNQVPTITSGDTYISNVNYSITPSYGTENEVKVTWTFTIGWNYIESSDIEYGIKAIDSFAADSTYSYTNNNYTYENDLTFSGTLLLEDSESNSIAEDSWILPNQSLTLSGLTVIYENSVDIYPLDADFNVSVTDSSLNSWIDGISSGVPFSVSVTTPSDTTDSETFTVEITDIPTDGSDISNQTFDFKVDATNPNITSITSSTHTDSTKWYSSNIASFTWSASDLESGLGDTYIYMSDNANLSSSSIIDNGTLTALTQWTSGTISNGIWYFYVLTQDQVGNIDFDKTSVKIDASTPNIVDITGANENVWQNQDSGPVISWIDPNSLSNDMFYITVDGTTPSSTYFAYATNQNSFNLPSLGEGEYTVKVIAKNGASTYSLGRDFIVRYDSVPTEQVKNLSATVDDQNRVKLTWTNPNNSDFVKIAVVRKLSETGGSNTVIYEGTATSFTDSGLSQSTKYYYTLTAYDRINNASIASNINITTKDILGPSKVISFNAVQSPSGISLTWQNPPDSDFSKVILKRNNNIIYEGTDTSFLDLVNEEGEYIYTILAYDTTGNSSNSSEFIIQFTTVTPVIPEKNVTSNKEVFEAKQNQTIEIKIPVDLLTSSNTLESIEKVTVSIDGKEYEMKLSEDKKYYKVTTNAPSVKGEHEIVAKAISNGEVISEYQMLLDVKSSDEPKNTFKDYSMYIYIGIGILFVLSIAVLTIRHKKK